MFDSSSHSLIFHVSTIISMTLRWKGRRRCDSKSEFECIDDSGIVRWIFYELKETLKKYCLEPDWATGLIIKMYKLVVRM